jgi:hypothetical protein
MSYHGLGKTFSTTLSTPFGNKVFSVAVPVEQWMEDGVSMAKGEVVRQMEPMIPGIVGQVLDVALPEAGDYVTNTLWPSLQPKLRAEIDRAIGIAENKATEVANDAKKTAAIIAGLLVASMVGVSVFTARRSRSKAA